MMLLGEINAFEHLIFLVIKKITILKSYNLHWNASKSGKTKMGVFFKNVH